MKKTDDKTKKKNWIDGDTFAVKIENHSKEYNGRYLILTKSVKELWQEFFKTDSEFEKEMRNSPLFYIKITNGKQIPNNFEELNKLDYIKTWVIYTDETTKNRFDKGLYDEADEFNYTYEYLYNLLFHREFNYDNFIYIGNYKFDPPKNEFIPNRCIQLPGEWTKFDWVETLLNDYEDYNLRKSSHFTEEGAKRYVSTYKSNIGFVEGAMAFAKEEVKKAKEIYLYGIGPKLYDAEDALYIRDDYNKFSRKSKKNNQSNADMIQELCDYYEDYITDPIDGPLFWIILTDLQMKNNLLTEDLKKLALDSIKKDLDNWKDTKGYLERKKELDKFKDKLGNYIFKN